MGSITHTKVSAIADDPAAVTAGEVVPSDWNDEHTFTLTKDDVGLTNVDNTSDANKPVSTATQTALDLKVDENAAITGSTKTKITYDAKGLVTAGADATTADIADSTNKRYVTDAQLTVIGNTSGTNTGDETGARIATLTHAASAKSALVDADEVTGGDSAASFGLIRSTWTNIKAFLKTYFDTLYQAALVSGTNIKTINSTSLLGSGDIAISASGIKVGTGSTDPTAAGTAATGVGHAASAAANYSTAVGANSTGAGSVATTGAGAAAVGGSYASGTDSFAAAIANNTSSYGATGNNSVAIGRQAKASGSDSYALGYLAAASGVQAVAIGRAAAASGTQSFALGYGAAAAQQGKFAFACNNLTATAGDVQSGQIVLARQTNNATPTVLTSNNSAPDSTNQVILPNDSTYAFTILVVARRTDANDESAGYEFKGVVDRNANTASTAIVGTVTKTVLAEDTAAWDCDVMADTTNGGLAVTVTGENAKTIRWVATCWTSEVTG